MFDSAGVVITKIALAVCGLEPPRTMLPSSNTQLVIRTLEPRIVMIVLLDPEAILMVPPWQSRKLFAARVRELVRYVPEPLSFISPPALKAVWRAAVSSVVPLPVAVVVPAIGQRVDRSVLILPKAFHAGSPVPVWDGPVVGLQGTPGEQFTRDWECAKVQNRRRPRKEIR